FHFAGFLRGVDVDRMFAMSDLYVMPSVSEPFGITPLEAMLYDVPVLLSRQSGVSEILRNALKTNFWDVRDMADKICAVLTHPALAEEIVSNCREEMKSIRWENAASQLLTVYDAVTGRETCRR
nr:glycosyltransferase family 4 protein [Desulfovibrio sp.]